MTEVTEVPSSTRAFARLDDLLAADVTFPDRDRVSGRIERFELSLQTVLDGIERRFLGQPG
jgi:hypothetical protein